MIEKLILNDSDMERLWPNIPQGAKKTLLDWFGRESEGEKWSLVGVFDAGYDTYNFQVLLHNMDNPTSHPRLATFRVFKLSGPGDANERWERSYDNEVMLNINLPENFKGRKSELLVA